MALETLVTVPETGVTHFKPLACVESAARTCPSVPAEIRILLVPSSVIKSPFLFAGDNALNPVVEVVAPVPPLAIGNVPVNCDIETEIFEHDHVPVGELNVSV